LLSIPGLTHKPLRVRSFLLILIAVPTLLLALAACGDAPPTPTLTSAPPPTVIVITAEGPYLAAFDGPGDWLVGDSDNSLGSVHDGEYYLSIKQPRSLAWTNEPRIFGDGVYEVNARLVSGPEASGYGILLMGSSDLSAFFYVMLTGDGRYDVGYCEETCGKEQSIIGGYKLSSAVQTDNQANHLKIILSKGQLSLEINGAPVSAVSGLVYSRGVIGLIGESDQYGGFEAAFDNFSVVETAPIVAPTEAGTPVTPVDTTPTAAQ
jgi:hypothetical protein